MEAPARQATNSTRDLIAGCFTCLAPLPLSVVHFGRWMRRIISYARLIETPIDRADGTSCDSGKKSKGRK